MSSPLSSQGLRAFAMPLTLRWLALMAFTGEMLGTVHRVLLETHQNELKPGSVLLLKQVGKLPQPRCPCLAGCPPSTAN